TYGFSKNETSIGTNYVFEPGFKHTVLLNIPLWSGWSSNAKKGIFKQRQDQLGLDLENTRSEYTSEMEEKIEDLNKDWQELHSIEEEIALSDEIWREVNKSYFIGLSSPELWFESLNTLQTWKIRQLSKLKDYSVSFNQIRGDVGRKDQ
ncbi:MAG: TolC family protein, partial [Pseudobdellovibrionaceae bacterium]